MVTDSYKKHEIRQRILYKRNSLDKSFINTASKKIWHRLIGTSEFQKAKIIMFYVSKDNEVGTHSMIKETLASCKKVCVPRINNTKNRIDSIIIRDFGKDLIKGSFSVLEPKGGKITKKNNLIIAPGVAFDKKGYRLGWGKGYYDKFLEDKGGIPKIGLAFDFQIVPELPKDKHDVPMDIVITEKRMIKNLKHQNPNLKTNPKSKILNPNRNINSFAISNLGFGI